MLRYLVCLLSIAFMQVTLANEIPPELKKWQGWVGYQQEFRSCPNLNGSQAGIKNNHLCAWPGRLDLMVDKAKAGFSQNWTLMDKSLLPLPGDFYLWPQDVSVNGKKAVVIQHQNKPYLELAKGTYTIKGLIPWAKRPETLMVPSETALFSLTINGAQQEFIKVDNGNVWLGSVSKKQVTEKDFLKTRVNRLIRDGHPMTMLVEIELEVAGRAREQKLTQFDLSLYQLKSIQSNLNSQLNSQGELVVQLKPGEHELRLEFKIHGLPTKLKLNEATEHWPAQELWALASNDRLRSIQIDGVAAIDSEQGFVANWNNYPHYIMNKDDEFRIRERHRGMSHSFDSVNLSRQLWLSFDGGSFYFRDTINGSKSKDWRINTIENYRLTQLSNHGDDRLITYDDLRRTGVEIRTPNLAILAGGQVKAEAMHHVSGWDMSFAQTEITLNIPPGRKLLAVMGADSVKGDWFNQWKLIDMFFVLVILALVFKVFGALASLLALLVLALGYHESKMPLFFWFNLMVAISLAKNVTSEKLQKWSNTYQWASLGLLLLVLLPFLADQIRFTLYPQLEQSKSLYSNYQSLTYAANAMQKPAAMEAEIRERNNAKEKIQSLQEEDMSEKITITGSRIKRSDLDNSYQQDTVIQAGSGIPLWQWQKAYYSWNGPVSGDEKIKLIILPETVVKIWRILLVVASVLWLLVVLTQKTVINATLRKWLQQIKGTGNNMSSLLCLFLLSGIVFNSSPIQAADYPSEKILNELKERLYPKALCLLDCATLSQAKLVIKQQDLSLTLDYQNAEKVAALIPDSNDWQIKLIQINGVPANGLWRNNRGAWLSLNKGFSRVVVKARLKNKAGLSIRFPELPKFIQHQIEGWQISGINQNRLMANALQLTQNQAATKNNLNKIDGSNQSNQKVREQSIAGLFHIERYFNFASQWLLTTQVVRQAPLQTAVNMQVPLLSFEQPLNLNENIKNGMMQLSFSGNQQSNQWQSSVSGLNEFELTALNLPSITESWKLVVYPNWNIKISGVPAVMPEYFDRSDFWVYEYYPRAGEKLNFVITQPLAVKGESVAITHVDQQYTVGKRKTTNKIEINYRATRAESLQLHIGDALLKQLKHDSRAVNLGDVDGVLSIPLAPGEHQLSLILEANQSVDFKTMLKGINISREFSNLSTRVNVSNNRWLLAVSGPGYGPAIIYWGELIFFLLLAIGLSRLPFSPLSYWQWAVLGLGMSTFSWPAMALVTAWLLGAQWRRQNNQNETIDKSGDKPNVRVGYQPLTSWLTLISTVLAVVALVSAVPYGLLASPDMGVVGNGSYKNSLLWFLDHGEDTLGNISFYSLPVWLYKGLMLLWSTWLSFSLMSWLGLIWKDLSISQFRNKK